jgi:conjugative transfer region lipoprotein (TIGR03751 family)
MIIQHRVLVRLLLISSLLFQVGCSGGAFSGPVLPQGGPTMEDIYKNKMQDNDDAEGLDPAREKANAGWLGAADTRQYGYTRTANNELNNLFPKLPNPTLVMYVYPHLAGSDEAPVPGYSTAFTMYQEDHFALPGELAKRGSN